MGIPESQLDTWSHQGSVAQSSTTYATVKDALAILVSFSAEKGRYNTYNPIFDKAIKTLRIVASNQLLFPKNAQGNNSDIIGIQVPIGGGAGGESMMPPPTKKKANKYLVILALFGLAIGIGAYIFSTTRKKDSHGKNPKPRTK